MVARTSQFSSHASFVVDKQSIDLDPGRQIDWSQVTDDMRTTPGQVITVGVAGAAAAATSVPVLALARAIDTKAGKAPVNVFLGGTKYMRITADAAAGATTVTTAPLPTALVSGDTGVVAGTGSKILKAGQSVGELIDITAGGPGKIGPRVVTTNPAIGLLATDAVEDDPPAALSGYGVIRGGEIYEALLPEAAGSPRVLPTAIKTELAANSKGFLFFTYKDAR